MMRSRSTACTGPRTNVKNKQDAFEGALMVEILNVDVYKIMHSAPVFEVTPCFLMDLV